MALFFNAARLPRCSCCVVTSHRPTLPHPCPPAQFPSTLALQLVVTLEQLVGLLMSAFLLSIVITKARGHGT